MNGATGFAGEMMPFVAAFELEENQRVFVEEYVKAVNSHNLHKIKSLIHPECLSCLTEENRQFYDDQFSKQLKKNIPNNYTVHVTEIDPDETLPFSEYVSYPVRPTHIVRIDYEAGTNKSLSLMIFVINQKGKYYEVQQCPKPEFIKKYREAKTRKEHRKKRSKELFLKLKDPLRSELITLINQGKEIQAIKRYSAETDESLVTADDVINFLKIERSNPAKSPGGPHRDH